VQIRGIKTNIPFMENVLRHPVFLAGKATTGFIETYSKDLFKFEGHSNARANKLLLYLADMVGGVLQLMGISQDTHTHTHIYIYIYIHTHTYIQTHKVLPTGIISMASCKSISAAPCKISLDTAALLVNAMAVGWLLCACRKTCLL
jgi:pyruvate carboxylase